MAQRPDVEKILSTLKPFQRRTVDYAFERLYLAAGSTRRFLVADEVGLGKTLIARGVVAKAVDHLWETTDRIDVVYICSNSRIARQNVNRLNLSGSSDFALSTRITMMPQEVRNLQGNKLNFIALTPGTSLDLKEPMGRVEERVLLLHMMQEVWRAPKRAVRRLFQGYVTTLDRFATRIDAFDRRTIDGELLASFHAHLARCEERASAEGGSLRARYEALCERFARKSAMDDSAARRERDAVILALRRHLAMSCVRALQPDLVILDEFQRFKELLDAETDEAALAQELFNYAELGEVRVLLLSATPYKMMTLAHEEEGEDHHRDFLRTYAFLADSGEKADELGERLRHLRRALYGLARAEGDAGREAVRTARQAVEERLRQVMSRTERRAFAGGDGMTEQVALALPLAPDDIRRYRALQRIARTLGQPDVLGFWKSGSYLLNFMEGYALKRELEKRAEAPEVDPDLLEDLGSEDLLLDAESVRRYRHIPPRNASLAHLVSHLSRQGAWRLLWVPPSLPAYQPGGDYRRAAEAGFTKQLVFSSWQVVPRLIATYLSYEAERRLFTAFDPTLMNTPEDRERLRGLLRLTESAGRLTGMPVLALLYPSLALAPLGDPASLPAEARASAAQALEAVAARLAPHLTSLVERLATSTDPDERWYWAAPLLLDAAREPQASADWIDRPNLEALWRGGGQDDEEASGWSAHVDEARAMLRGERQLGRPPEDLLEVLAQLALAGPAVVALRALARVSGGSSVLADPAVRDAAGQVAFGFRSLFNRPETMALLRGGSDEEESYWRRVLQHAAEGCLQSVVDEYAHVLHDLLGLFGRPAGDTARELAEAIAGALTLRTPTVRIDDIRVDRERRRIEIRPLGVRNQFALRFAAMKGETDQIAVREDQVRHAFNSPFWPFVLATTSMGQEGLDFHPYCHRLVHWNLPANPVDLEQREGRIHRYKGHALRKNLAEAHGNGAGPHGDGDLWAALFEAAGAAAADTSGLVPYWLFAEGSARVESSAPHLPHSREQDLYDRLRRSLAVYRMVFGQPAQEDLIGFLLAEVGEGRLREVVGEVVVDLGPVG